MFLVDCCFPIDHFIDTGLGIQVFTLNEKAANDDAIFREKCITYHELSLIRSSRQEVARFQNFKTHAFAPSMSMYVGEMLIDLLQK